MSHSRHDEIYEELSSLRQLLKCFDGSRSLGITSPAADIEAEKIWKQIHILEAEDETLK